MGGASVVDEFLADGVDLTHANAARMYDYFLGGGHNFAVDRDQAAHVIANYPDAVLAARANRAFLGRAVTWCLEQGIDQFLDLGSGVPTVGNVHEIALRANPAARVAYVDFEPVAAAHAAEIVADLDTVTITHADLRRPHEVLAAPGVAGLLDPARPVALLAVGVLHFVPGDVATILATYRATLCPGSALVLNHTSVDHDDPTTAARMQAACDAYRGSATEPTVRDRREIRELVAGLELVEPGLVDITRWPQPTGGDEIGIYSAVALVPRPSSPTSAGQG
jgi:hypothetical protein